MSNHPSDALPACEVQPRKREHYHARRLQCHQEIDVSRTLTNLEYDGDNEMKSDETNYDDEAKDRSNYEEDHSVDDNDEYDELCSSSSISSQSSKSEIVNNFD